MKRTAALHVVTPVPAPKKRDQRIGLMNPAFKYTRAAETNVAKTIARIKREMAKGAR